MNSGRTVAIFGIVLLQLGTFLAVVDDLSRAVLSLTGMLVLLGVGFGIIGVLLALDDEQSESESGPAYSEK